jgi:hypothetical protein
MSTVPRSGEKVFSIACGLSARHQLKCHRRLVLVKMLGRVSGFDCTGRTIRRDENPRRRCAFGSDSVTAWGLIDPEGLPHDSGSCTQPAKGHFQRVRAAADFLEISPMMLSSDNSRRNCRSA